MPHEAHAPSDKTLLLLLDVVTKIHRHLEQLIEISQSKSLACFATKTDLKNTEKTIMSAISDFAVKQEAFNDRVDTAITGVIGDIKALNDLVEKLQTTPGPISAEDQASLDALEVRGDAIAAKLEALDALTPPVVPTVAK